MPTNFLSFLIISPWKRALPFICASLKALLQRCFVQSLVEIGQVVLEKKMNMWNVTTMTTTATDKFWLADLILWIRWANRKNLYWMWFLYQVIWNIKQWRKSAFSVSHIAKSDSNSDITVSHVPFLLLNESRKFQSEGEKIYFIALRINF